MLTEQRSYKALPSLNRSSKRSGGKAGEGGREEGEKERRQMRDECPREEDPTKKKMALQKNKWGCSARRKLLWKGRDKKVKSSQKAAEVGAF